MWLYVLLALFLTMVLGYLLETIKIRQAADAIRSINLEIYGILAAQLQNATEVDIFFIDRLRDTLQASLIHSHKIDELQLYKVSVNKLRLAYRKGLAVERIDLYLEKDRWAFKEVAFEYAENPFEELHLQ
jgi:hypothetical protein